MQLFCVQSQLGPKPLKTEIPSVKVFNKAYLKDPFAITVSLLDSKFEYVSYDIVVIVLM